MSDEYEIRKYPPIGEGVSQTNGEKSLDKVTLGLIDTYCDEYKAPLIGGRIIIIGNAAVGKTALFRRFLDSKYSDTYKPTIGLDFSQKAFNMWGIRYQVQILDTAGEERFQAITEHYYRNADAAMVCFDLNDVDTLPKCSKWAREVQRFCGNEEVKLFLVGCKSDLLHVCEDEDIEHMCKEIKAEYFPTSALSDRNVNEVFQRVGFVVFERTLKKFYRRQRKESEKKKVNNDEDSMISLNSPKKKKTGSSGGGKCC